MQEGINRSGISTTTYPWMLYNSTSKKSWQFPSLRATWASHNRSMVTLLASPCPTHPLKSHKCWRVDWCKRRKSNTSAGSSHQLWNIEIIVFWLFCLFKSSILGSMVPKGLKLRNSNILGKKDQPMISLKKCIAQDTANAMSHGHRVVLVNPHLKTQPCCCSGLLGGFGGKYQQDKHQ